MILRCNGTKNNLSAKSLTFIISILLDIFNVQLEIKVENLNENTFNEVKQYLKMVFNSTLNLPEDWITLQYDESKSRIMARQNPTVTIIVNIEQIDSSRKDSIEEKLKVPGFINQIKNEMKKYKELEKLEVPNQEVKPIVKPVSSK